MTCAIPGHPGVARREHLAMNLKIWAAGSHERWWIAMPSLQQRTYCPQRLELSAGEMAGTWLIATFSSCLEKQKACINAQALEFSGSPMRSMQRAGRS